MKRIFFIIYITVAIATNCNSDCKAQDLIAPQIMQNGQTFGYDHIFTSPDPIEFSLNNPDMAGEWSVDILYKEDGYDIADFQTTDDGKCIFCPDEASWAWAERQFDSNLQQDLFEVKISFTSTGHIIDCKTIKLALTPPKPIISDIEFTYIYNWDEDMFWPDGNFTFKVYSNSADYYFLYLSESFLFEPPRYFPNFRYRFDQSEEAILNYDADWGEYFVIHGINKFGYSPASDMICTTDYITDEKILNRINELKQMATNEDIDADYPLPQLIWKDNIISSDSTIDHITIYNLYGKKLIDAIDTHSLDLSQLNQGVYIITYTINNHTSTLKILKQ